jgi:O-antigen biosynthesis protein
MILSIFDWIKYYRARKGFPKTRSLALPLPPELALQVGTPRIAVVLHLYYVELASEIADYLANISLPFDLLISTDSREKQAIIAGHPIMKLPSRGEIRIVPNRGRDMAPKLVTFVDDYARYDLLLFIHSKRSRHHAQLSDWFNVIMSQLLGTQAIVDDAICLFQTFPKLGIIAPNHFEQILPAVEWGPNWRGANRLASRMGIRLNRSGPMDFPSGSMFWARPQALKPLLALNLSYDDFEFETGQTDGALGHQLERLFYFACEKAGYLWLKIARRELYRDKSRIVEIRKADEIDEIFGASLISRQFPKMIVKRSE